MTTTNLVLIRVYAFWKLLLEAAQYLDNPSARNLPCRVQLVVALNFLPITRLEGYARSTQI